MANGSGVSVDQPKKGQWRVRWRETIREADGTEKRVQRSKTVSSKAIAQALAVKVLQALERGELYDPEPVRAIPPSCTVDDVLAGWLRARAAAGDAASTITRHGQDVARALKILREIARLPADRAVPGAILTRNNVIELAARLSDLSAKTVSGTVRIVLRAWSWASDDPAQYPGLGTPPRVWDGIGPKPVPASAPRAPSLADCDAVLRQIDGLPRNSVSLPLGVVMRYTGLRVGQALALKVGDVDLAACSLVVRTGKSKREKAEPRTVPISEHLRDWLLPRVAGRESDERLIVRRVDARPDSRTTSAAIARAWKASGVDPEVWAPSSRERARPDHAFRAALQAHLVTAGVRDEVIDTLVGHAPKTTRDRHYVDASSRWEAMKAAVATIPPVDWRVEVAVDNVVELKR